MQLLAGPIPLPHFTFQGISPGYSHMSLEVHCGARLHPPSVAHTVRATIYRPKVKPLRLVQVSSPNLSKTLC